MKLSPVLIARCLVLAGSTLPMACTSAGVVGGDCRAGLSVCDGDCVDLQNDDLNCGQCGRECPSDMPCAVGVCGGDLPPLHGRGGRGGAGGGTGGPGGRETGGEAGSAAGGGGRSIGGSPGGAPGGGENPGGGGTVGGPVGGVAGSPAGGAAGGPVGGTGGNPAGGTGGVIPGGGGAAGQGGAECVPPFDTPDQCGDCDTRCSGSTPVCAPVGATFECVPVCDPPLVECGGKCVELSNDPFNCGECFKRCASGICQSGVCVGAVPGNLALMCLNYEQTFQGRSQQVLLGNAVFLANDNPVRVLAYTQYTSSRLVNQVTKTLDWASNARGRSYDWSAVTDSTMLSSTLSIFDHDVLLVLDQDLAPSADEIGDIGGALAGTIDGFARAGGVVVVLSGSSGDMVDFFTNASLLEVNGQTDVTGTDVYNRSPGNVIGVGVFSPFRALADTCVFETDVTEDRSTFFVVTDTDPAASQGVGKPVVVHRVVSEL